MLERYNIRTDLALEERERFEEEHVEIAGVEVKEEYNEQLEMKVTTVKVTTENGAKEVHWKSRLEHILLSKHRIWLFRMKIITEKFQKNLQNI